MTEAEIKAQMGEKVSDMMKNYKKRTENPDPRAKSHPPKKILGLTAA